MKKIRTSEAIRRTKLMSRPLPENYVRRCYNRFAFKYWREADLPEFDHLDFAFEDWPDEWGHVEWDMHGLPHLSLHPSTRLSKSVLKGSLLHEMIHIFLGPSENHGYRFWKEAERIHGLGALKEHF